MTYSELQEIANRIRSNIQCPKCKGSFGSQDIHIVGTFFNEAIFHLICAECSTNAMLFVVFSRGQVRMARKHVAVRRIGERVKKISINDVLDIKNALKKFDGDFKTLF